MPKGQRSPERPADAGRASSRPDQFSIGFDGAEVRRASEWLGTACRRREIPQAHAERLELCLHEALANVITHGGESASAVSIALSLEVGPGKDGVLASVTVSDACAAFNPLSITPRPPSTTLDDAAPGGLGLVMIRRCADWLDYRHEDGRNHFTFGVRWDGKAAPAAARFGRGPDRRGASVPVAQERRRGDRRSEEIRWIPLFRDADPAGLAAALADCEVLLLPAAPRQRRGGNVRSDRCDVG